MYYLTVHSGGAEITLTSTIKPQFNVYIAGTGYTYLNAPEALTTGKKYHIVGTYDGTTMKLYINGELVSQLAISGTIGAPQSNTTYVIGANPNDNAAEDASSAYQDFGKFKIYSAKIYTKARTAEQIQQAYSDAMATTRDWAREHTVPFKISEELNSLAAGAQVQYGWSTSNTTAPTSWTTYSVTGYTTGAKSVTNLITQGELTGKYYLWVKPYNSTVKDTVENITTASAVSPNTYWFDNTAPTGTITSVYATNQDTVTVTISNMSDAESGLNGQARIYAYYGDSFGQYYTLKDVTYDPSSNTFTTTFNFSEISNTTTGATNNGDGTYGFRLYLYDNVGNYGLASESQTIYDRVSPTWIQDVNVGPSLTTSGLVRYVDAENNTGAGHSSSPTRWTDLSGYNNGSIQGGATFTNDNYVTFDGVDDYYEMTGSVSLDNQVTLEATFSINAINAEGYPAILNFDVGGAATGSQGGVGLTLNAGAVPKFELGGRADGTWTEIVGPSALNVGQKYHLVGTYDGSIAKFYIDGILVAQTAADNIISTATFNGARALVGARGGGANYDGTLTNMNFYSARIYNTALTQAEVTQNYNASTGSADRVSSNLVTEVDCSKSLALDGVDDYVDLGSNKMTFAKAVTLEANIEISDTTNRWRHIITDHNNDYGITLELDNNIPLITIKNGRTADGTIIGDEAKSTSALEIGKRYQLVGTYDGTTLKLYVNGTLCAQTAYSIPNNITLGGFGMGIGRNPNEDYYHDMNIFSTRIYNKALTQAEIENNRNKGYDPITDGLLRNYDATNNSGNGFDSSATSWTDLSVGQINGATFSDDYASFDGTDDWVNLGQLPATNTLTYESIVEFNEISADDSAIIMSNGHAGGAILSVKPGGTVRMSVYISENSAYTSVDSSFTLNAGQKYHIAGTYDGTSVKLYIDGVLAGQAAVTGTIKSPNNNTVLALGSDPNGSTGEQYFNNMNLYTARVYNTALTQEQLQANLTSDTRDAWKTEDVVVDKDNGKVIITVTGTDDRSGVAGSTLSASNLAVFMDNEQADSITKEVSEATTLADGSVQHTITLSGFEEAFMQLGKSYREWSGTIKLQLAAGTLTDKAGNINVTEQILAEYVDFTAPAVQYKHQSVDIDKTNKKYNMTFEVTDKYYASGRLTLDDLTILMQNGQLDENGNPIVYNLKEEPVTISLKAEEIRITDEATNTETGVVGTLVDQLIGHKYTLTIENLDQMARKAGMTTVDYSGIVTVAIAEGKVFDKEGNSNIATTITSGVDLPGVQDPSGSGSGGSGSGDGNIIVGDPVVIDVVSPIWERVSSTANLNGNTGTATAVILGSDTYLANSSLTTEKMKVFIDGIEITDESAYGITKTLSEASEFTENRLVNGVSTTRLYGLQYTFTISGFPTNIHQLKIQIQSGTLSDEYGNYNRTTDIILYNELKPTYTETSSSAGFLGYTGIKREDIERVNFISGVGSVASDEIEHVWDASAQGDNSIIAWTADTEAPYTVYVGSRHEMYANKNSSYLFANIGYGSSTTATETIGNLNLLHTEYVKNMQGMFWFHGYNAMTTLDLSNLHTSNVTNMREMFAGTGYKEMTTFNFGENFDTSKVTDMSWMFSNWGYTKMNALTLPETFTTANVTKMSHMFMGTGHTAMYSFNLGSNFDTSKVTDMSYMFKELGYTLLPTLDLGDKFDTSLAVDMKHMFERTGYTAMTSIDLGDKFNPRYTADMSYMFAGTGYTALTSLDLGDVFYTTSATDMTSMFENAGHTALESLDLGPAFTKIPAKRMNIVANCGNASTTMHIPEAIYGEFFEIEDGTGSGSGSDSGSEGGSDSGNGSGSGSGSGSGTESTGGFYIPEGYTQVEGTDFSTGLVVQDASGNQFVWVEVPQTSTVYATAGLNITEFSDEDYDKIEEDLHEYTATYRLLSTGGTTAAKDEWSSSTIGGLTENQYNIQKKKMLKSIYKNGGFYIGRYETGVASYRESSSAFKTPLIKQNKYPYNNLTSTQAQRVAQHFTSTGYTSSLLFGVQWDLTLKYLEVTEAATVEELTEDSTGWGNYQDSTFEITNSSSKYRRASVGEWVSEALGTKTATHRVLFSTGASDIFAKQNIYDLAGNVREYTLEAVPGNTEEGIVRGQSYYYTNVARFRQSLNQVSHDTGFRVSLYKDEGIGPDNEVTEPAYIPEGYTHVEGSTMENGYVIKDALGNEFVWIEVPKTAALYETAGVNITAFTDDDYAKIEDDLHEYTMTYRLDSEGTEADQVDTWYEDAGTGLTEEQYNTQKKKMLKSIYMNEGFYVGRYEAGSPTARTSASATLATPVIQKNAYPYNYVTSIQAQQLSQNFTAEGYTSSLMFNVQWDLILKYLETKGSNEDSLKTNSTTWGSYSNHKYIITNSSAKYYVVDSGDGWQTGAYGENTTSDSVVLSTGATNAFMKQNIYDLAGGLSEFTLAIRSARDAVAARGSNYSNSGIERPANYHGSFSAGASLRSAGFRVTLYKDEGTGTVSEAAQPTYIPEGYEHVAGTTMNNGYVIQDASGNQYVWVEVPKTVEVYRTAGLYVTDFNDGEYEKIEADLQNYTSVYRNGTSYVDEYYDGVGLTETQYNLQKKKMLKSIYINGGFYVGRYETGIDYSEVPRTSSSTDTTQTPIIKQNAYPYSNVTTSQAQELSEGFAREGYTSSLMFGVQWDLILKYLETKGTPQAELITDSASWGNYGYTLYNIENSNAKYSIYNDVTFSNWESAPFEKVDPHQVMLSTGASEIFKKQNIYNLAGNEREWTLEFGEASSPSVFRGGSFSALGSVQPVTFRYGKAVGYYDQWMGFRTALYKDEGTDAVEGGVKGELITNFQGEIDPRYRTEWIKTTTHVADSAMQITLRGQTLPTDGTYEYTSDVESLLPVGTLTGTDVDLIKVYIGDEELTDVTKTVGTATTEANATTGANDVIQTITLSNFEEEARRIGKPFKEWSGNLRLEIARRTLKDNYGSKIDDSGYFAIDLGSGNFPTTIENETNLSANTSGSMFVDVIRPEITYVYSTGDIDQTNKIVKVEFSVTDKYFASSGLTAENLTILVDGIEPDWTKVTKTLELKTRAADYVDETTGAIYKTNGDIYYEVDGVSSLIGKQYVLTLEHLEQSEILEGKKYLDYSGVITVAIPEGQVADKSGNTNVGQTITMGVNIPAESGGTILQTEYSTPYLPEGYSYVEGNFDTGITIQDSLGNQYVWVEVPRNATVYDSIGTDLDLDSMSETELATALGNIETELQEYATDYRDPDNYIDEWYEDCPIASEGEYNALKNKMLKSVYQNGGFYIGKYETGTATARTSSGDELTTAVIKQNMYPYNYVTVTQAQGLSSGMASEYYNSSLMFGIQWDLVMKYLESKGVAQEDLNEDSSDWGNYGTGSYIQTGSNNAYSKMGIYDLAGNVYEFTLEQYIWYFDYDDPSINRGGSYGVAGDYLPASAHDNRVSRISGDEYGFRVALYKEGQATEDELITIRTSNRRRSRSILGNNKRTKNSSNSNRKRKSNSNIKNNRQILQRVNNRKHRRHKRLYESIC